MVEMRIAVTLSPAVQGFWHTRSLWESEGLAVPEGVEDAWERLMRIRDHAESQLREIES